MTDLDIRGFVQSVLEMMVEAEGSDLDGGAFEDLAVKHGLFDERPATAEDCETEQAQEYGIEVGDPWIEWSDALKAYLK